MELNNRIALVTGASRGLGRGIASVLAEKGAKVIVNYRSGAKEVHVRPACPPILFGCKYVNFSRSNTEMELIARRVIRELEGENVSREILEEYADPDSERYAKMVDAICKQLNFTSLRYNRLDDMIAAVGLPKDKLCTYCWDGRE